MCSSFQLTLTLTYSQAQHPTYTCIWVRHNHQNLDTNSEVMYSRIGMLSSVCHARIRLSSCAIHMKKPDNTPWSIVHPCLELPGMDVLLRLFEVFWEMSRASPLGDSVKQRYVIQVRRPSASIVRCFRIRDPSFFSSPSKSFKNSLTF